MKHPNGKIYSPRSFTDNLYQHSFGAAAIKLTVEDLFPGPEKEPPPDATFSQAGLHLLGDIDHPPPGWYLKPQFLMIAFHNAPFFVCSGILINLL
jgi:hypothetical protein